jgi:protein-S-isoprenylcysteine O-methyltransferase Ste14
MDLPDQQRQRLGSLLVGLQFALIAALALLNLPLLQGAPLAVAAVLLAALGLATGLWALWANPPGNFNIRPVPRAGGHLVARGPYRWIRHPMYTSVLLCGLAAAWNAGSPWGWLALVALAAVLLGKARLEERWMAQAHPGYTAYRSGTWWLVPGLF